LRQILGLSVRGFAQFNGPKPMVWTPRTIVGLCPAC
jgi:hypothetical protein